jgi:hypothetical protein
LANISGVPGATKSIGYTVAKEDQCPALRDSKESVWLAPPTDNTVTSTPQSVESLYSCLRYLGPSESMSCCVEHKDFLSTTAHSDSLAKIARGKEWSHFERANGFKVRNVQKEKELTVCTTRNSDYYHISSDCWPSLPRALRRLPRTH